MKQLPLREFSTIFILLSTHMLDLIRTLLEIVQESGILFIFNFKLIEICLKVVFTAVKDFINFKHSLNPVHLRVLYGYSASILRVLKRKPRRIKLFRSSSIILLWLFYVSSSLFGAFFAQSFALLNQHRARVWLHLFST